MAVQLEVELARELDLVANQWDLSGLGFEYSGFRKRILQPFFFRLFTEEKIKEIDSITIYDIILQITNIKPGEIQRNPFFLQEGMYLIYTKGITKNKKTENFHKIGSFL